MSPHSAQSIPSLCLSCLVLGCVLVNGWMSKLESQSTVQSPKSKAQDHRLPAEPQTLNPGEKHTYPLTLKANDFLKLVVEQQGIDVVVRLLGPDGNKLAEVDSPNGTQGPEPLSFIVEQGGSYTVEVESLEKTAEPGKYELKLEAVKPATEQDRAEFEIGKLLAEVEQLRQAGKYDQGLPLAQQAVKQSEKIFGAEHLLAASSLNTLALLYQAKGDLVQAEPLFKRALAIREKALGPDHPDVAQSLNNLAGVYKDKGDFVPAEPLYQRSLAIWERTLGPDHPDVSNSLNNLAVLYFLKGDSAQAELHFKRSLAILERVLGPDHLAVALGLNNLAVVYQAKGDYVRAEPLFQRSLAIREKVLGPDHPDVAASFSNLGVLYRDKGDFVRAEPLYQQALAIREKMLGPDHRETATSLNNLGVLYQDKGDFVRAEPLLQRSLAVWERALGPDHPDIANNLNNLAGVYKAKGDYVRAEPLLQRALAIREKALGPDHPDVAYSLNNLAVIYEEKGDYVQAEPLFQRALAIREKVLGPDHPDVAQSLNNLGALYQDKGDFEQAESLYQRALAIREKVLGPDRPDVAQSLNNLGALYQDKGDFMQAEPLFQRALAIREKALGPDHPDVAQNLNNLAGFYLTRGKTTQAIQYRTQGNDATERDLMRNLVSGSEQQKALYLKKTAGQMDQSISLSVKDAPRDEAGLRMALTVILRRKGRTLDAMTNAVAILRNQSDPETQKLLDDYTSIVGQISAQTLKGPGKKKPEEHLAYLKSLKVEKDKLENDISRRSGEFKVQTTPITLEGVQHLIPADAALVEYAVYHPYDAKTRKTGAARYVAYVVKPGSGAGQGSGVRGQESGSSVQNPQSKIQNQISPPGTRNPEPGTLSYVDLGEAEPIDQAVALLRKALSDRSKSVSLHVKPAARALDQLVMKPVRILVGTTRHLLISPDGALNLIPFSALADEQGKFLVEKYTLTYLTSGRDLLRLNVKLPSEESPLVLANPDYALGTGPVVAGHSLKPLISLPATAKEGQNIQKLVGDARLVVKTEATENTIKAVRRPSLLHVATHGYFLTDTPPETPLDPTRNLSDTPAINTDQLRIENPLLRSWLFFAGANRGGSNDNDGIMTALEAAQLNLWGTKLVTLSACETGVGEAKTGDGVYGLRRALVLAGSEAQLMSLWSVSDQATRTLMVDYYTRLKAGEGRSAALRNVQLDMLKDPRRQHPFYWASFIQSGEWANLEGKR